MPFQHMTVGMGVSSLVGKQECGGLPSRRTRKNISVFMSALWVWSGSFTFLRLGLLVFKILYLLF